MPFRKTSLMVKFTTADTNHGTPQNRYIYKVLLIQSILDLIEQISTKKVGLLGKNILLNAIDCFYDPEKLKGFKF